MIDRNHHLLDYLGSTRAVSIGVVCAVVLLSILYFQTASLDRQASDNSNKRIALVLEDWTGALVGATENLNVQNSFAPLVLLDGQLTGLPLLDATQIDTDALDWVAALDADGQVLESLNLPDTWNAAQYFDGWAFERVLAEINAQDTNNQTAVSGAFEQNGHFFLAAATTVKLPRDSVISGRPPAFLVGGKNLDEDALANLGFVIGINELKISTATTEYANGSLPLAGPLGLVGSISWQAELQGTLARKIALPWILLVCFTFVFLIVWLLRRFRTMSDSLTIMHEVATTDQLTGLANRTALNEILQFPSTRDALASGEFAVISLDLNDFKQLNDELGHQAGDTALRLSAERIASSVRSGDKVIRIGGDEFVCLIFDKDAKTVARKVADRLQFAFDDPMDVGCDSRIVTPSIGIAISEAGESWEAVRERSDWAMYQSKRSQKGYHVSNQAPRLSVV